MKVFNIITCFSAKYFENIFKRITYLNVFLKKNIISDFSILLRVCVIVKCTLSIFLDFLNFIKYLI